MRESVTLSHPQFQRGKTSILDHGMNTTMNNDTDNDNNNNNSYNGNNNDNNNTCIEDIKYIVGQLNGRFLFANYSTPQAKKH